MNLINIYIFVNIWALKMQSKPVWNLRGIWKEVMIMLLLTFNTNIKINRLNALYKFHTFGRFDLGQNWCDFYILFISSPSFSLLCVWKWTATQVTNKLQAMGIQCLPFFLSAGLSPSFLPSLYSFFFNDSSS